MAEHTPTPWNMSEKFEFGTGYGLYAKGSRLGEASYLGGTDPAKANAAFIIKAVNNHDALVKALEVLLDEAMGFSVSGVYFDEDCMGHKGPALARAALDAVGTPSKEKNHG